MGTLDGSSSPSWTSTEACSQVPLGYDRRVTDRPPLLLPI